MAVSLIKERNFEGSFLKFLTHGEEDDMGLSKAFPDTNR